MSDTTSPQQAQSALQAATDLLLQAQAQLDRVHPVLLSPVATLEVVAPVPFVKPGWQTSEFWLVAFHQVGAFVVASGVVPGLLDPTTRAETLASALVTLGMYMYSRFKAKQGQTDPKCGGDHA